MLRSEWLLMRVKNLEILTCPALHQIRANGWYARLDYTPLSQRWEFIAIKFNSRGVDVGFKVLVPCALEQAANWGMDRVVAQWRGIAAELQLREESWDGCA